jgi:molecular chaperone DnaJ
MAVQDPYKVLGVAKGAKDDEIKKAYRKLARQWHPDRNPGNTEAEDKFKEVQEAYSIVGDPEKRRAYDSGGWQNMFGGGGGAGAGGGPFGGVRLDDLGGLGDIFGGLGNMFGGGRRGRQRAERGSDLETEVSLSFDQSIDGTELSVSVPRRESCGTCKGIGAAPGTTPKQCPRCQGSGMEQMGQGMFSISQPCSQCRGAGSVIEQPCPTCKGSGQVQKLKRYRVQIPAGVRDGSRIRLAGKGEPGVGGGPAGDLFVVTRVAPSPVFKRKGEHLEVEVPVSVTEALLGATIEVPTLAGTKQIKVPPGTRHGMVIRLSGEGPKRPKGGGRGDIRYRVDLVMPKDLNDEQREAARDLAAMLDGDDPRAALLAQAAGRVRATAGAEKSADKAEAQERKG